MAQVTELQPNALPGVPHVFLPKTEAAVVEQELVGIASADPTFIGVASTDSTFIAIQAGAEMTIFAGNDFDATVQDLRKSSDNSFKNDAVLTVELLDATTAAEILAPISLPSDGGATGGYRVTIPGSTFVAADEGRRIRMVIDGTVPGLNWDILETVRTRG